MSPSRRTSRRAPRRFKATRAFCTDDGGPVMSPRSQPMLHCVAWLVPVLLGQAPATPGAVGDPCDSVVIGQTRAALDELRASGAAHRPSGGPLVTAVYEGTVSLEGHLM